jgi:ABC-type phosphate transport system auxiliary subunit
MSAEQLEKEKEVEEKIVSKVTSLTGSLGKMSKQSESLRMELANLEKGPQNSKQAAEALAKKKEELAHGTAKIGAVFETMQGELEQRLKIAKVKGEKRSIELATVRERWRQANHDVTDAQAELDGCQTRIAEVSSDDDLWLLPLWLYLIIIL